MAIKLGQRKWTLVLETIKPITKEYIAGSYGDIHIN